MREPKQKKPALGLDETFTDKIAAATADEIKAEMIQTQKGIEESKEWKKTKQEVLDAKQAYQNLVGPVNDTIKASNNRLKGTAGENKAVIDGSLSHFGKYTADDKSFTFQVETSTYPNWDGTTQNRPYTLSGDQLKYVAPAASGGGSAELVWKRIK